MTRYKCLGRVCKPKFDSDEQYMPVGKNNTQQTIAYTETILLRNWHKNAKLYLETVIMGCTECDLGGDDIPIIGRIFAEVYKPVYTMSFITPHAEPVKQRSETYTAILLTDKVDMSCYLTLRIMQSN